MLILFFLFLNFLLISLSRLFYPYGIEQTEWDIFYLTFYFMKNPAYLYHDIYQYPFYVIGDNPPLFHLSTALFSLITKDVLFSGRTISFISTLLSGFLIYKIVEAKCKSKLIGLASSMLFFSSYVIFLWGSLFRVDMLGVMLNLMGINFILNYRKGKNLYLAIICFILATYTKWPFIIAAIATSIYLLIDDRKKGFKFLLLFSISVTSIFILLNILTGWQFYLHIFAYKVGTPFAYSDLALNFIETNFIFLIFSFFYIFRKKEKLLGVYLVLTLAVGLLGTFRIGGYINYLIEPVAITCILVGLLLGELKKKNGIFILLLFLIIIQLSIEIYYNNYLLFTIANPKYLPIKNLEPDKEVLSYIKNSQGNIYVESQIHSVLAGKEPSVQLWTLWEINDFLNKTKFFDYFKNQNYTMMIINGNFYLFPELNDYLHNNYNLVKRIVWYDNNYNELDWEVYMRK